MSNSTNKITSDILRQRLATVVRNYHAPLHEDERRLQQAMLEYERSFCLERVCRAA